MRQSCFAAPTRRAFPGCISAPRCLCVPASSVWTICRGFASAAQTSFFSKCRFHTEGEPYCETVYNVSHPGLTVVMAHIDRYPEEKAIRLIEECGVYVQLNAECFAKFRGRRLMSRWLGRGCVAAYGSDIHGADKTAACRLGQMFEKTGDAGIAVMTED